MNLETRILVGYDGSDDGLAALIFAAREAACRGGQLNIVYAVDDTVLNSAWGIVFDVDAVRNNGMEVLAQAREIAQEHGVPEQNIRTDCVVGGPGAVLSKLSESASLLVVGRRAEGGDHSMFVGSTTVGLAAAASCPIVVISALNSSENRTGGVIGVGIDPEGTGTTAVAWAMRRAKRIGASVSVFSVVRPPAARLFRGGPGPTDDDKRRLFDNVRDRVSAAVGSIAAEVPGVPYELHYRYGSPSDELVELSRQVDMLIVGVKLSFPMYSVGGVPRALMAHAHCPLGLIRYK